MMSSLFMSKVLVWGCFFCFIFLFFFLKRFLIENTVGFTFFMYSFHSVVHIFISSYVYMSYCLLFLFLLWLYLQQDSDRVEVP